MQEDRVVAPRLQPELARRFEEGEGLDIAGGAADFGDRDIRVGGVERPDRALDLVGDVRNHLHGRAEVAARPLPGDHVAVDAA